MKLYRVHFMDGSVEEVNGSNNSDVTRQAQQVFHKTVSHVKFVKDLRAISMNHRVDSVK